ncbi:LppA family lipoprotein [Amycolatopsis sp. 3B14]|uniref:LppA family lipoprotein n=1 Tax=Amycolatopsis sp. 3B14 TaxID=3243600 RepID=UPI003D983527
MVGNRDGVAAWARNEANLAMLPRERDRLRQKYDRVLAQSDGGLPKALQLLGIQAKLDSLDAIDAMMHLPDGTVNPERQLLSLDLTGRVAKAAIAHGDVDTARHVAVFTPGMNSAVDQNMAGYVNDMEHVQRGAEKLARLRGDGGSVATVTWLGYEPPAVPVARFNEGINASRPDDPHLTALGHSYGSLTTGIALQRNTGVDDVVFFGSPGISDTPDLPVNPVGLNNELSSLQVPSGHAYNLSAEGDPIAHDVPQLGRYGSSPATIPGMQQLSTHEAISPDGQRLVAAHGHSEYTEVLADGTESTSVYNIQAIVAGTPTGGDNGGTVKVLRRTAVLVALAVITASGCSGNDPSGYLGGPTTRNGMNADQQFQELMQRPTTEEVVARYRLVLDQLRDELTSTFGVQPWTEAADGVRNFNGCARAFPAVHLWDATEQSLADLVSDVKIPEDRRSEARRLVVDFAARNGFDRIKIERAGPDTGIEIWFSDAYGGELVFGSAKRTLLGATTGCHLYTVAKERGTPRSSATP